MNALILAALAAFPMAAHATKVIGNGGDTYAIEFVDVANEITNYLKEHETDIVDSKAFAKAVSDTSVESTDKNLSLEGKPKDAINYPTLKKIVFNRKRWTNTTDQQRAILVLHEYLGILQVEGATYEKSKKLLSSMNFNRAAITLVDAISVNFATPSEYSIETRVSVVSYGVAEWIYNAADEKIQITIEAKGQRKLFNIPIKGRVLSVHNANDGIDSGIYIKVLQPILSAKGIPESFSSKDEYSVYIKHAVKEYRIEFSSREKGALPEEIEWKGPISNQAG